MSEKKKPCPLCNDTGFLLVKQSGIAMIRMDCEGNISEEKHFPPKQIKTICYRCHPTSTHKDKDNCLSVLLEETDENI